MVTPSRREGELTPNLTPERKRLVDTLVGQFLRNPEQKIALPNGLTDAQGHELAVQVEDALWTQDPNCWQRVVFEGGALRLYDPLIEANPNDSRELAWAQGFIALKTALFLVRVRGADTGVWEFGEAVQDHSMLVHDTFLALRREAGLKLQDLVLDLKTSKLHFRHEGFSREQPESSSSSSSVCPPT